MDILQQKKLLKFGAVPFTTDVLEGALGDYSAPIAKIAALADENKVKRMTLWFSIITLAVIPIYYLSYRLAVKWYLKGVESYAK